MAALASANEEDRTRFDWSAEQLADATHTSAGSAHHRLHTAATLADLPAAAAALPEGG